MKQAYKDFKFYSGNRYMIFVTIENFTRTASGASWKTKAEKTDRRVYDDEKYTNYISAIPFFNNFFGYGAYCRAHCGYTEAGFLPVEVVTVSPGRDEKTVARFFFIHKNGLEKKAGWREMDIINRANGWQFFTDDKKHIEIFTSKDADGDIKTGVFNRVTYEWVN